MRRVSNLALAATACLALAGPLPVCTAADAGPSGRILRVGPDRAFKTPRDAARAAHDGDTVLIAPGDYPNETATWPQSDLTIRGDGGLAMMHAPPVIPNRKAIWVLRGDNVTIERIGFRDAKVPNRNGAGIRHEGGRLVIRDSLFDHNQMGILMGELPDGDVLIEGTEFRNSTVADKFTHAIYIGHIKRFTLRFSYVHATDEGHHVKSRALENHILYNRLSDEADGNASYLIDLPNCGISTIIGNVLHKGRRAANTPAIAYGAEGCVGQPQGATIVNNTFVSDLPAAVFVRNFTETPVVLINNLVVGARALADGPVRNAGGNLLVGHFRFVDAGRYDYRLPPGSPAIDAGVTPKVGGVSFDPVSEYVHPLHGRRRVPVGPPDIGAYEARP